MNFANGRPQQRHYRPWLGCLIPSLHSFRLLFTNFFWLFSELYRPVMDYPQSKSGTLTTDIRCIAWWNRFSIRVVSLPWPRHGSSRRVEHFIHLWWHLHRSKRWVVGWDFSVPTLQIASDCRSRSKSLGLWMQPHREWCLQGGILE